MRQRIRLFFFFFQKTARGDRGRQDWLKRGRNKTKEHQVWLSVTTSNGLGVTMVTRQRDDVITSQKKMLFVMGIFFRGFCKGAQSKPSSGVSSWCLYFLQKEKFCKKKTIYIYIYIFE